MAINCLKRCAALHVLLCLARYCLARQPFQPFSLHVCVCQCVRVLFAARSKVCNELCHDQAAIVSAILRSLFASCLLCFSKNCRRKWLWLSLPDPVSIHIYIDTYMIYMLSICIIYAYNEFNVLLQRQQSDFDMLYICDFPSN